jgi:hypothetical protein
MGQDIKEGTAEAAAKAKEGLANFSDDVKQKYPKVVASMQQQFDAMNTWAVDTYRDTFTSDAPERDKLVDSFKADTEFKPKYTIDKFDMVGSTDTEAVANVEITYTGTDVAKPMATQHKKYRYIFHKQADSDDWKVFKIEPM